MSKILQFKSIDEAFHRIVKSEGWQKLESQFERSKNVIIIGNGGNLAVAEHGSVDIARLTNKRSTSPGSSIRVSSLINDEKYEEWYVKWLDMETRSYSEEYLKDTLIIGISSSGVSKNIMKALQENRERCMCSLITAVPAQEPLGTAVNVITLGVDMYHTSEVLSLLLFYQLIESSGHTCPPIKDGHTSEIFDNIIKGENL